MAVVPSRIRFLTRVAIIGALAITVPAMAVSDGGSGGGEQGLRAPAAEGKCRAPGKNLAPVKIGPVAAGGQIAIEGAGGQIDIEGAGQVRLSGSFLSWGTVRGMSITVQDRGGDGIVRVGRRCVRFAPVPDARGRPVRTVMLRSPHARFLIDGTNVRVTIFGAGSLAIAVTGSGTGLLNGVGTFRVNNGNPQSWPLKPINLALAPTS